MSKNFSVMQPKLDWIGDICFRNLSTSASYEIVEEDMFPIEHIKTYDDDDLSNLHIKHLGDKFVVTMNVPTTLHWVILRGKQKQKIENDLKGTKIEVPSKSEGETVLISIVGKDERTVKEAYRRVDLVIESARCRIDFTHFLSIPMNFDVLKKSFLEFKEDVLKNCKHSLGLSEKLFQNPDKLHLTLGTLILLNSKEREDAASVLQGCRQGINDILRGNPLIVSVKGIDYMNDDPSEVDVLYAKVEDVKVGDCLQRISDLTVSAFQKAGFLAKESNYVKLHITVINSLFGVKFDENSDQKKRATFDAKAILENYADYDFGIITVSEIHISIRHSRNKDGYYQSSSLLTLTTES